MIEGCDVSAYQATLPPLGGFDFLIARATYGVAVDPRYADHIARARDAGLVTGAYAFGRSATYSSIRDQLDAFASAIGSVDLVALDLESDGARVAMSHDEATEWIDLAHGVLGRRVLLYHSTSGFPTDSCGADGRWVADYRTTTIAAGGPPIRWDLWQYTSSGGLDRDRFRGTRAELRALGGPLTVAQADITSLVPMMVSTPANAQMWDLDGVTKVGTIAAALPARVSPYGVGAKRAIYVDFATGGTATRVVLVTPATSAPINDVARIKAAAKAAVVTGAGSIEAAIDALK